MLFLSKKRRARSFHVFHHYIFLNEKKTHLGLKGAAKKCDLYKHTVSPMCLPLKTKADEGLGHAPDLVVVLGPAPHFLKETPDFHIKN